MIRVYCRCNSGHYFSGGCCPLDGWSSAETDAVLLASERLMEADITPSIDALRKTGLKPEALARTIVVQFGSGASVFDAIAPEGYVVNNQWHPLVSLDRAFK